jgi:23S rRNA (cytidine1920-2'-O)/16S rRNA (cytidine1409-2'-O)-methyltransferase
MTSKPGRLRADDLLVQRGLAENRSKARALIMAGDVRSKDNVITKPGHLLEPGADIVIAERRRYVSRGGLKLAHALDAFGLDPAGMTAADIGASTGGFTDCLLQRGAKRVYAIDVGYGQLAYSLRTDPRVVVLERINARELTVLPELVDLVTIDVSFISLRLIVPTAYRISQPEGRLLALIKPQFEAGRDAVGRTGVVRDGRVHRQVLRDIVQSLDAEGWRVAGLTKSPIEGPAGNVEFLGSFEKREGTFHWESAIDQVLTAGTL